PAPAEWAEPVPAVPLRRVPVILTDFSSEPYSVRMLRSVARTLAPVSDAVLVGEHQDRPDFPPTLLASMLQDAGLRPWMAVPETRAAPPRRSPPGSRPTWPPASSKGASSRSAAVTGDVADPMEAEFDTVAEWTAQVAADLGPEYYIPAACRGSGLPVAL